MTKSVEDDLNDLLAGSKIKTTEEVEVPKLLVDQVIGQEHGVEVIKKAAKQRRHVMLIGTPGTGKSMLGNSMAELLPKEELQDILVYPNPEDKNTPKIRVVPFSKGKEIVDAQKQEVRRRIQMRTTFLVFSFFLIVGTGFIYFLQDGNISTVFWAMIAGAVLLLVFRWVMPKEEALLPKLLVSNFGRETGREARSVPIRRLGNPSTRPRRGGCNSQSTQRRPLHRRD